MSGLLDDDGDEPGNDSADDDLLGGADDGLMGDDMGFADDDDGGDDEEELSYRLDEVEKEIDALGNKVETVRGENETISDSIQTVERNVDRLVDMYEIVTQGINPFVGDQEIGNAFESATGGDGMFGADDDPADGIDEDITNASAEEFLDDDLADDAEPDDFDSEFTDEADDFDDLDAADEDGEFEESLDDEIDEDDDEDPPLEDDEFEADPEATAEPAAFEAKLEEAQTPPRDADTVTNPSVELGENGEVGDPPYLVRCPSRPDVEVITLEWLKYLIETSGLDGAAGTIAYYESIDWISESVEFYLQSLLNGFTEASDSDIAGDPEPKSVLEPDEHKRSLQYIARIATPEKSTPVVEPGVDESVVEPALDR